SPSSARLRPATNRKTATASKHNRNHSFQGRPVRTVSGFTGFPWVLSTPCMPFRRGEESESSFDFSTPRAGNARRRLVERRLIAALQAHLAPVKSGGGPKPICLNPALVQASMTFTTNTYFSAD